MSKKVLSVLLSMTLLLAGCGAAPTPTPTKETPTESKAASNESEEAADPAANAGKPVALTFYFPTQVGGDLASGMEKIVNRFNEQNKDIVVTPVYTGSYKQTAQKAMTDISAGQGPNVILSGMLDIVDYYKINAVKDISSFINKEGDAWKSDFIDGFWSSFNMDGGVYGLPFQHSVCVLYYNKDMLDAASIAVPTNWEETLAAMDKLKAAGQKAVPMEFPADSWVLENLTMSNGSTLASSKTKSNFDSPEAAASLTFMRQMVDKGAMIADYAGAGENFLAESSAMMLNTTGSLGFVAKDATFNWGVSLLPVNTSPKLSYGGGGMIMMNGQTPEEEAASWKFMTYMTSPEVSAEWMTVSGYFAVRKSSADLPAAKDYYAANPQLAEASKMLQYTDAQWTTDKYWDVYALLQTALDETLIKGSADAADALATAQKKAEEMLK